MSIPDNLIINYFELATYVPLEEISKIKKALAEGENPRNLKMRLAREIVTLYHDTRAAEQAEKEFIEIFSNKGKPEEIETRRLKRVKWNIVDLIAETGLTSSKSEARRIIEGRGVRINDSRVESPDKEIDVSEETLIQVGKRRFLKVKG